MGCRFHLYIDDSGSRLPDRTPAIRADGMDHFALGGILIAENDLGVLLDAHATLRAEWQLISPLHSTRIRGKRGPFARMAADTDAWSSFMHDSESFLVGIPATGFACVIDRIGYNRRYSERYQGQPWLMCKTAYAILLERAAKFVRRRGGTLEIYVEQSGRKEDRAIRTYHQELKTEGLPFDPSSSAAYDALSREHFSETIFDEPHFVTKATPMIQVADLYLFAMAKGGYDPTYGPYRALLRAGRIIDALLDPEEIPMLGVKYSCFDWKK